MKRNKKIIAVIMTLAFLLSMVPMVAFGAANNVASKLSAGATSVAANNEDTVTFTINLFTSTGVIETAATTVYLASDRGSVDTLRNNADTADLASATPANVKQITVTGGEAKFKVKSAIAGDAKIAAALTDDVYDYLTGTGNPAPTKTSAQVIDEQTVTFTSSTASINRVENGTPKVKISGTESSAVVGAGTSGTPWNGIAGQTVKANNIDWYELVFEVYSHATNDVPVSGQAVTFSSDKTGVTFDKASVTTDNTGKAKIKVFSTKPGTYAIQAKAGSKTSSQSVIFAPIGANDISLASDNNETVARDQTYEFKLSFADSNGNKVDGSAQLTLDAVTKPTGSTVTFTNSYSSSTNQLTVTTNALTKDGDYKVRASLENGKYVDILFTVKKQGDITKMELSFNESTLRLGAQTSKPTVKLYDAAGIMIKITGAAGNQFNTANIDFVASDWNKVASIDAATGQVTATTSDKNTGAVVITAIDTNNKLTANYTLNIANAVSTMVAKAKTEAPQVNDKALVTLSFVDKNGDVVALGDGVATIGLTSYVISKPDGSIVTIGKGSSFDNNLKRKGAADVEITSNATGTVNAQIIIAITEGVPAVTTNYTVNVSTTFGAPPAPKEVQGAAEVTMIIGAASYVADGTVQSGDLAPFIEDGRTFVPVRFLAEAFEAAADWTPKNAAVEVVTLTRDDISITITIGSKDIVVVQDGQTTVVSSDVAAQIKDGRTVLPFRVIAEAFGAEVDYGPKDGAVEWVKFNQ